jgi:hypothetical protein
MALTVSPSSAVAGQTVTFTAALNPSGACCAVALDDYSIGGAEAGVVNLSGGRGTSAVTSLGVGTHSIYGQYYGNAPYEPSDSSPVTVAIAAVGADCGLVGGAYEATSGSVSQTGQRYAATAKNQSALCATGAGTVLTLNNPTVTSTFNPLGYDDISGLGAAVLAYSAGAGLGGTIDIVGGTVEPNGEGIDAVFASGPGATVNVTGATLTTTEPGVAFQYSDHAAGAGRGGSVVLNNVTASNSSQSSYLLAADGDGSSIAVTGGTFSDNGVAGIARLEGASSLSLTNVAATTTGIRGIVLTNGATDGSAVGSGTLTMSGGSLTVSGTYSYPQAILVQGGNTSGANANISLTGTALSPVSSTANLDAGFLVLTGTSTATLDASGETIVGDFVGDPDSTLTVVLQAKTAWTGYFVGFGGFAGATGGVSLTVDATSSWTVTGNTTVGAFSDPAGISGGNVTNVTGNGFTVTYDTARSPALGGRTYQLVGGGVLLPGATN